MFNKAREELKLKNLLIIDLEKAYGDSDSHLKKYEKLYEIVKSERNKYVKVLSITVQIFVRPTLCKQRSYFQQNTQKK
jgi:hypothetical protein